MGLRTGAVPTRSYRVSGRRWTPFRRRIFYAGFGRSELPRFDDRLWEHSGPKTSYGTGPGFEAASGCLKLKVKFLETRSEPFTARIFAALGYNVEPTDHVPGLKSPVRVKPGNSIPARVVNEPETTRDEYLAIRLEGERSDSASLDSTAGNECAVATTIGVDADQAVVVGFVVAPAEQHLAVRLHCNRDNDVRGQARDRTCCPNSRLH